ncbi:hypothetical protein BH23PSE1_BH23PSE1_12620 [soil metagenome]
MDFDPEAVLGLPLMAHLATLCPQGPRDSPVWFLWEEGKVWLVGNAADSFVARLVVEPRCALGIVRFEPPGGILLHVGIRGRAEVGATDPARFRRLLAKYLGPDETAWNPWFIETIARIDSPAGRMIAVTPASIVARNVSYFRTGPDLAWPAA